MMRCVAVLASLVACGDIIEPSAARDRDDPVRDLIAPTWRHLWGDDQAIAYNAGCVYGDRISGYASVTFSEPVTDVEVKFMRNHTRDGLWIAASYYPPESGLPEWYALQFSATAGDNRFELRAADVAGNDLAGTTTWSFTVPACAP